MFPQQYPYSFFIQLASDAERDEGGHFLPSSTVFSLAGKCRDEANSKGGLMTLEDSTVYTYESVIYLPFTTDLPTVGQCIEVRNATDQVRVSGEVKRVAVGQFNARVWI